MDIPYSLHMPQIVSFFLDIIRGIDHRMKKKLIPQILSLHFDKIWGINASNLIITFDQFWGINKKHNSVFDFILKYIPQFESIYDAIYHYILIQFGVSMPQILSLKLIRFGVSI